jgi:hypothetical protein
MVSPFNPVWAPDFDEAFRGRQPKPIPVITVAGQAVSCHAVFLPLTITHGRSNLMNQPDPPSLSMVVRGRVTWQRNDPITVTVGGYSRFSGFVSALTTGYKGQVFVTKIEGVGWLAKAGAVKPSIPPRPIENDVARVSAYLDVFAAAFGQWQYAITGTATNQLIAQDVDGGHTVLDLVHEVCESTGALFWQSRDGAVVYGTANHRVGEKSDLFLDNCDVVDGIEWVKNASMMVNRVKIKYGSSDPRAEHIDQDTLSITQEGPKEVSIDSLLDSVNDATLLANLILYRRTQPYWNLPGGILVRTRDMSYEQYLRVLALDVSDEVAVRISRDPDAPENLVEWVVEGWVEEWNVEAGELHHTMQFALSDRQRFGLTGIRTVGELAAEFTVGTAAAMTVRDALFKEIA